MERVDGRDSEFEADSHRGPRARGRVRAHARLPPDGEGAHRAGAGGRPQAPVEPAGPPSPEVQAAVQGVLDSGRHPWLTWPEVTGALPYLEALYAAEPDGLFWFAGDRPHPALGGSAGDARPLRHGRA